MNQNPNKPPSPKHAKSSILGAVNETMQDFHAVGLADKRTMRQFDALCMQPIEPSEVI
jgi:putative transcriptional regulator